jgi:hypothetical protein
MAVNPTGLGSRNECAASVYPTDRYNRRTHSEVIHKPTLFYKKWERRSWLKHYATSRKDTGSIPDEIIEFFQFT